MQKCKKKALLAWRRERTNQYGGNTKDARDRNVYIAASKFVPVVHIGADMFEPIEPVDVWSGDIYVHFYDMVKMKKWREEDGRKNSGNKKMNFNFAFPVESVYNLALREGYHFANKDNFDGKSEDNLRWDNTEIRDLYSAENDLVEYYPKNPEIQLSGQYDNRVMYSDEKVNGNLKDSWRSFKYDNYRDIDGLYGPINKLIIFQDNLFGFQDRALSLFSINPVAVTTTTDQASLVLGTGAVIQDYKYLSTEIGSKHQWSIVSTNRGLYWVDILSNAVYKAQAGQGGLMELSRVKGLKSYFESKLENSLFPYTDYYNNRGDAPMYNSGIVTGYDSKNNEVLFSFLFRQARGTDRPPNLVYDPDKSETICFSETTQTFTSFYDFATPMFVNTQDKLLSVNPKAGNEFYLHNNGNFGEWYTDIFNTTVEFVTNKMPTQTKVFDNFEWHTEVLDGNINVTDATWSEIEVSTDYQNSAAILTPGDNIKRRERTWKTPVLRNKEDSVRLRDKYLTTKLTYDNSSQNKIRAHYVKTKFRVSRR